MPKVTSPKSTFHTKVKHAFTLGYNEMKAQQQLRIMLRDQFGYADACNENGVMSNRAMKELLDSGVVLDKHGERIAGGSGWRNGSAESRREFAYRLYDKIKNGDPIYIYKKGEDVPYEVRYDPKSGKLTANPKNIEEMEKMPEPDKPTFRERILNFFLKAYDIELPSCKKWRQYQEQQEALSNARDSARVDRAKAYGEKLDRRAARRAEKKKQAEAQKQAEAEKKAAEEKQAEEAKKAEENAFLSDKGGTEVEKGHATVDKVIEPPEPVQNAVKSDVVVKNPAPKTNTVVANPAPKTVVVNPAPKTDVVVSNPVSKNTTVVSNPVSKNNTVVANSAPKTENKPVQPAPIQEKTKAETMIEQVEKLEGRPLSEMAKTNLEKIILNGEKAQQELQDQILHNEQTISGEKISDLLILKSVEKQITDGKVNEGVMALMDSPDCVDALRMVTKLSEHNQQLIKMGNASIANKALNDPAKVKERVDEFHLAMDTEVKKLEEMGAIEKVVDPQQKEHLKIKGQKKQKNTEKQKTADKQKNGPNKAKNNLNKSMTNPQKKPKPVTKNKDQLNHSF